MWILENPCQWRGFSFYREAHRAWWVGINKVRLNTATPLCQSLRGFDCVVAALSAHYFRAVRDDLTALSEKVGPKKLFVVATGVTEAEVPEVLWPCFLPIGVAVEGLLNGPRHAQSTGVGLAARRNRAAQ